MTPCASARASRAAAASPRGTRQTAPNLATSRTLSAGNLGRSPRQTPPAQRLRAGVNQRVEELLAVVQRTLRTVECVEPAAELLAECLTQQSAPDSAMGNDEEGAAELLAEAPRAGCRPSRRAASRPCPPARLPAPMYVCRKVKNSQARTGHRRGMGGRETGDDGTHERHTDTNKLTRRTASWLPHTLSWRTIPR